MGHLRRIAAACLCLLGLWLGIPASGHAEELPLATQQAIDAIFADHDRTDSPGYALGIVHDGRLIYARGYGSAELDYHEPITARTAFHLASLSKQFTAAAVALLMLDGKLDLETPVARYFPQIAHFKADLRIKHLIYFTSGLPEYTSLPRANGMSWYSANYFSTDEAIATVLRAPRLKFVPGTQWDYSNINYMLLAKIVEQISGQSLAQFLAQRVFTPLGMTASLLNDDATQIIPNRATGYAERSNTQVRSEFDRIGIQLDAGDGYLRLVRNSPHYGGSGIFSTLEDLARWDENFYTGQLGGAPFLALMQQRMKFRHDKDNDAFGLVFGDFHGQTLIWFSGGDLDTSTYMARLPAQHLSVICLSNLLNGDAEGRAHKVLELLLPEPAAR